MYETFFEMKHTPFVNAIPVEKLYQSSMLDETLARLEFVAEKRLFAVITSDVGCGKTTAIRKFTSSLPTDQYQVLYLSDSKLTPRWFYKGLLDQLGVEAKFYRGDAKRQLHNQLQVIRGIHGKTVVTIVDEAHLLDREMIEEIRFLLNYKMDSSNPMALILVGQNELWEKLKLQRYAAVRQRLDIKCEIPQMTGHRPANTSHSTLIMQKEPWIFSLTKRLMKYISIQQEHPERSTKSARMP